MKKLDFKTVCAIVVFYLIAIATRYLAVKTDILSEANIYLRIIAEGIGPTLGVIVACFVFKLKFSPMTLKGYYKSLVFPSLVYWIIPILLIPLFTLISKGTFPIFYVFMIFFYGLLEEIGWRGFLQQQLQGLPKFLNILIVAILWFVWHLNFDITTANLIFFGLLIFGSWGIGIVADKTKSLLLVAAFHSLNNVKSEINLILIALLFVLWIAIIVYMEKKKGKFIVQAKEEECNVKIE
jgi:membrane protease YdiL (CAAX protease family)